MCPPNNAVAVKHVLTAELHRLTELACAVVLIDFGRHKAVEAVEDIMNLLSIWAQQWNRCR